MRVAKTHEQLKEWNENNVELKHKSVGSIGSKVSNYSPFVVIMDGKGPAGSKGPSLKDFKSWAHYKIDSALEFKQKQRYEWFCAGFLLFYDVEVRNNTTDHIIYFKWSKKRVEIFISPGPVKGVKTTYPNTGKTLVSDPPKPPPPPPPPMG